MKGKMLLVAAVCAMSSVCTFGQSLTEVASPLPAALCVEAPMPPAMQAKYDRLNELKKTRLVRKGGRAYANAEIDASFRKYVYTEGGAYRITYANSDRYTIYQPQMRLMNTSHGKEKITDGSGKFNVKKDRISYAVLEGGRIQIINKGHKRVDMSEFRFDSQSEAIRMEGNAIRFTCSVLQFVNGESPMDHKIVCTHMPSSTKYTFDLHLSWAHEFNISGGVHSYCLTPCYSEVFDNLAYLVDLDAKEIVIVRVPLLVNGDGKNGVDGKRGANGANGTDEYTYKDSNGNTQRKAGTCGAPGKDGANGTDGTDGAMFLFCLSPDYIEAYGIQSLTAFIDGGIGGKGGKGGRGGRHGKGASCSGTAAPNGKDGRDGKDGKQGDFLFVESDVDGFLKRVFN